jgi:hypothetical protein
MRNLFYGINAKVYHWYQFTKSCLGEYGFQVKEARELSKLGMNIIKYFDQSAKREFFKKVKLEDFSDSFSYIFGVYFTTLSHHDAIQILSLSGHGLNSLMILGSQLETLLILLYMTEPDMDLREVMDRIDYYIDYVKVKMKQNMEKSLNLSFYSYKCNDEFNSSIFSNYEEVCSKYLNNNKIKILKNCTSFPMNKKKLAEKYNIKELYDCIFAESSASIHATDISDRMQRIDDLTMSGFKYTISHSKGYLWSLMMSNLVQYHSILYFSKFFGIDHILRPKLLKIFKAPVIGIS